MKNKYPCCSPITLMTKESKLNTRANNTRLTI